MTSTPSSYSEGEVLTSDSEKATQTLPSRSGISVDRPTRKHAGSLRSSRSRSRSRSPYRASRGGKRRRHGRDIDDSSKTDSRSQNVRNSTDDRPVGRLELRPHDTDLRPRKRVRHAHGPYVNSRYSSDHRRSGSRSRSRSPFRHSRFVKKFDHQETSKRDKRGSSHYPAQKSRNGKNRGNELSVSERNRSSESALTWNWIAKPSENGLSQVESKETFSHVPDNFQASSLAGDEPDKKSSAPVTNEAALIEQRRKRREALKAKYRSQQTPLIVQALHPVSDGMSSVSNSIPTLQRPEQPVTARMLNPEDNVYLTKSTGSTPPRTPKDAPESPAEILFEYGETLANVNSDSLPVGEEEPSAADYDPTVDMQEERARHDKRLFNEGISTSADARRQALGSDGKAAAPPQPTPRSKAKELEKHEDRFDMFAEDDAVDMLAEATSHLRKPAPAADAKTAQSLDVKMMDNWDDSEGYYTTIPGELLESRYHVLQNLGRGMFSSVVRATDTKTNKLVAIKIVRSNDAMRKAGIKEIGILKDLAANDPEDKRHMIRLERSFEHKGHLCMVFENLSLNLREVLKKFGRDVGINLKAIRAYAQQLFLGLSLLRKCQYLHADVKPDNILVNDARNVLKICDLGSASPVDENVQAPYLVSRFYRAPEIILGIPYDYGIDIWSIGCTLFELYTGKILFTGRNNNGMLRSIMECRGKFPHKILRRGSLTYQYFDDLLNFQAIEEDQLTGRKVAKMVDIKAKPVKALRERLVPKGKKMDEQERREVELFADLLDKCLDLRGDKRITPSDALRHPFIVRAKP